MPFEKGHKKAKGRPKGVPNKTTQEIRDLLESNKNALVQRALDLALSEDTDKTNVTILTKLLDKIIPTLQHTEFNGSIEHKKIKEMSDAELYRIANSSSKGNTSEETS